MGRSYTLTWEGHYKTEDDKENEHHLVYGMTISEIIKTLINLYHGNVAQFTVRIWHQINPVGNPVRELRILKNFSWPKPSMELPYIHDVYRSIGLDYNKPIPRRYYELKTIA